MQTEPFTPNFIKMPPSGPKSTPARINTKRSGNKSSTRTSSTGGGKITKADRLRIREFEEEQREAAWLKSYIDWPILSILALLIIDLLFFAFCFLPKPQTGAKSSSP